MNIDELSIVIKVDSGNAVSAIDTIIEKVNELNQAAGTSNDNMTKFRDLADSMRQLGLAGKAISDIHFEGFGNIARGVQEIGGIDAEGIASKINLINPALEGLARASQYFNSDTRSMGSSVDSLTKALNNLSKLDDSGIAKAEPIYARLSSMLSQFPRGIGHELKMVAKGLYDVPAAMHGFKSPSVEDWAKFQYFMERLAHTLLSFDKDSKRGADAVHNLSIALKNLNEMGQESGLAENLRKSAIEIQNFMTTLNRMVSDTDLERFSQIAQALHQVSEAYTHLASAEAKAGADAARGMRRDTATYTRYLNMFASNLKKTATQVWAFGKKLAWLVTTPFRKFGSAILSAGNAIKGFFQRFARLAMLRLMRMAIMKIIQSLQEGVKNLYAWSATVDHSFAHAMDTIATAGLYFKNSIAAMFSPLIEAIAPILDAIVDRVVAFINVINQLFALLTGRTVYTAAIKGAKAYEDAAGGAAAAQEELNRTVLGFDELNRLNGPKGNGGGGGGGASGGEGIFEVRDISDLAERLFNDEDWTWLGTLLTDKLTEQMQSIDWDKIQRNANGIATRISTFLNGAFGNREFWETLGTTFGEGINTITGFIDTFFQTTEWTTAGESFGAFLRNGIDTIDWEQLGRTITDVPRMITQWIHGFVSEWTVEDWTELGDSIAEMVNAAFFNIDWATAIPDVVEMATGILHAINTAISEIEWSEMFAELREGFENADWDGLWAELKEFISNTAPVWGVMLAITITGAVIKTAAAVIRQMVVTALAGHLASAFGGSAAGVGTGAGVGGAIMGGIGKAVAGGAAMAGAAITIAVTAAVAVTIVMSVARANKLSDIQRRANNDASMYRNALNQALSEGMIDRDTYMRGMDMTNDLYDLYYENLERNPWDVFGTQFEIEAEAITQGLENILYESGYTADHIHRNVSGKLALTEKETQKFTENTKENFVLLKDNVVRDMGEMGTGVETHMRALRDKSDSYLSTMKTTGTSHVETLRKNVTDKLSKANTDGTSYIDTLRKNVTDKLSKANTDGTSYTETLRKNVVDKLSDAKTKGSKSIGDLTTDIGSKLSKASTNVASYGGNVGQKFAEGISGKVNTVNSAVAGLASKAANLDLKNSAYAWGSDLGQKYADGINAKGWAVEQAAKNTANKVSKYLHFSEPDVGPLSNFHTFAPDMMRMYAQGIEENKQLVLDQLQSVTGDMREVFTGVGVNYSQTVETNYDGLIAALADREEPINVYIGNSKLDTVLAKSSKRTDLRTGGR